MLTALLAMTLTAGAVQSTDFIGFSRDGRTAAVATHVATPRGNGWDTYSLVKVVDAESNAVIETYRGGELAHRGANGKKTSTSTATLTRRNRDYKRAKPLKLWVRNARRRGFGSAPVTLDYESVRLLKDKDTELNGRNLREALLVAGQRGGAVGYHVRVLTVDGTRTSVAHFRREPGADEVVSGEVRAFLSRDKKSLAVVNTFGVHGDEHARWISNVVITRMPAKVATAEHQFEETGTQGMGAAWARYTDDFGPRVPAEYRYPHNPDPRRLANNESHQLFQSYTEMLGGEFTEENVALP